MIEYRIVYKYREQYNSATMTPEKFEKFLARKTQFGNVTIIAFEIISSQQHLDVGAFI